MTIRLDTIDLSAQLVSVVIPTRNRSTLLNRAIASVIAQSHQQIEVIVIDDHSEDNTEEVVLAFSDHRISYVSAIEYGRSRARNLGISLAKGEFLTFLDDDDVFDKDKVAKQLRIANAFPSYDFFIGKSYLKDELGNRLDDAGIQNLDLDFIRRSFLPGTVMICSIFIRLNGDQKPYFDPELDRFEDLDFYFRYFGDGNVISHEDLVATVYTHEGNSINGMSAERLINEIKLYRRKHSFRNSGSRKGFSILYTYYGDAFINLPGFYRKGISYLLRAIALNSTPINLGRLKVLKFIIVGVSKRIVMYLFPIQRLKAIRFATFAFLKKILMRVLPINNSKFRYIKFGIIYKFKLFGKSESASGPGSDLQQTVVLLDLLPKVFSAFKIRSLADIPCGDFFWMNKVDLSGVNYAGFDIVRELIETNKRRYPGIDFHQLDITRKPPQKHDLILCRDLFVHLSFQEIFESLKNLQLSGSVYLLTTTFPTLEYNSELGQRIWRPLNLEIEPFNLGVPIRIFSEESTEDPRYADKSLGLWKISEMNLRKTFK